MFKGILRLVFLIVIVVSLGVFFHKQAVRWLTGWSLRTLLGVPVEMQDVRIDWRTAQAQIADLLVRNPEGFPEGILAKASKIFIELDPALLWQGQLQIRTLAVDCEDLRIVRNEEGNINWLALKPLAFSVPRRAREGDTAGPLDLRIEQLVLSLGFATYTDLASPVPSQQSYQLEVTHAVYKNVGSVSDAVAILGRELLKRIGLETTALKRVER